MARYLVGTGNNCWDFKSAYNAASAGDIIEFDKNFNYDCNFTVDKDITFVGHIGINPDGSKAFLNSIASSFVITNGGNVTFENFLINQIDATSFTVDKSAALYLKNVKFNSNLEVNRYTTIYVKSSSKLFMDSVEISFHNSLLQCHLDGESVALVENSVINGIIRVLNKSELTVKNVSGYIVDSNFISVVDSKLIIENTFIESGKINKFYPALFIKNSKLISNNTKIKQSGYDSSVYLDDSNMISKDDLFSGMYLNNGSNAYLENLSLDVCILIENKSFARVKEKLALAGENTDRIDICMNNDSSLIVDEIEFVVPLNPNVKVGANSFAYLGNILFDGDVKDLIFVSENNGKLIDNRNNKKAINQQINSIIRDDNSENALDRLNELIGLKQVKKEINKMLRLVEFNKKRQEQGLKQEKQALHSVFMGNPGTGKTTVARLMGQILFDSGVLTGETPIFEEVSQEDLVSENVGGTAPKTRAWLDKARGGILFVDEAYNLYKKEGINHGQEAIDTIMKYMEDYRDEIIVIFAGYTKEMEQFLKSNPGLESRAPNIFYFEDYSEEEIVKMGEMILAKDQYNLEDRDYYAKHVSLAYSNSLDGSNARWIRNFNQKLTRTLADRVIEYDVEDVSLIINKDIDNVVNINREQFNGNSENALDKLNRLIGIQKVKEQINDFIALANMNKKRLDAGLKTDDFSLHSLFLGNPGTGKTTVARIIGDLLFQKGIIKQNKFVEASRSDLVGKYIGHTAAKTREVLESALGGVLFIDEAYTLNPKSGSDFGQEAIDEILKFMEDYRRDIVIIFAGYSKEMADFLNTNSGLRSRVPNVFDFMDYSPDEIVSIGLLKLHSSDYVVNETVYADSVKEAYMKSNDNSNGRWIRNYNERLLRIVSRRLSNSNVSVEEYNNILDEDILKMKEV